MLHIKNRYYNSYSSIAQLTGAVEYTDWTSAEE